MPLIPLTVAILLAQTPATAEPTPKAAEETAPAPAFKPTETPDTTPVEPVKPPPVEVAPPAPPPPPPGWKGTLGGGLIYISGNTEAVTFTGNLSADRNWSDWTLAFRAAGAYGVTTPSDGSPTQVVALRGNGSIRGDRNLTDWVSLFASLGVESDHVKSVEWRGFGELGAGFTFVNQKDKAGDFEKTFLRFDVAARFAQESRFNYYPTPASVTPSAVSLLAPRLGLTYRYAVTKDVRFSEEAEVMPNVLGQERYLVNSNTKFSSRLTESLSLNVSFLLTFDSSPATGKKPTDTSLTVGLEAAF